LIFIYIYQVDPTLTVTKICLFLSFVLQW